MEVNEVLLIGIIGFISCLISYCIYLRVQINELDYRITSIENLIEMMEEEDTKDLE